jgi:hypothetical protein
MKFELSISTEYLPDWTTGDGIRELVQNAKDCETQNGCAMEVKHSRNTLRITNVGARLDRKAMLFGHSTNRTRGDLIGQFGEGLKLGVLALVRSGNHVVIRSGADVWKPSLKPSEAFGTNVLVFDVRQSRNPVDAVEIEVQGITKEAWEEIRKRFVFLHPPGKKTIVTSYGILYQDAPGMIFAKGIFVQHDPDLRYGYDFSDLNLDRDRRMAQRYDLESAMSFLLCSAAMKGEDFLEELYKALAENCKDTEGVRYWHATQLWDKLVQKFRSQHGEGAFPVENEDDRKRLAFFGKTGVMLPKVLCVLLHQKMGGVDEFLRQCAACITDAHPLDNLEPEEIGNLARANCICHQVYEVSPHCDVVDFADPLYLGMWRSANSCICIARKILMDPALTLRTLMHEYAHAASGGGDGDPQFISALESAWSKAYERRT